MAKGHRRKVGGIAQKSTKSSLTLSTDSKRLKLVTGLCLAVLPELGRELRAFLLPGPPLGWGVVALCVCHSGPPLSWVVVVVSKVITAPIDPPDDFKVIDRAVGQVATPRRQKWSLPQGDLQVNLWQYLPLNNNLSFHKFVQEKSQAKIYKLTYHTFTQVRPLEICLEKIYPYKFFLLLFLKSFPFLFFQFQSRFFQ